MTKLQDIGMVRIAGVLIALALVPLVAISWRPGDGQSASTLDFELFASASSELELVPSGRLLSVPKLMAGSPAGGPHSIVEVRNATGSPMTARVRVDAPSSSSLDRLVSMRVESQGKVLAQGNVTELRSWSDGNVELPPHEGRWVKVSAWLSSAPPDAQKRSHASLRLRFDANP
jgi:hypothetical protein